MSNNYPIRFSHRASLVLFAFVLAGGASLGFPASSQAATITFYNNLASWQAAVTSLTANPIVLEDLNSAATFSGSTNQIFDTGKAKFFCYSPTTSRFTLASGSSPSGGTSQFLVTAGNTSRQWQMIVSPESAVNTPMKVFAFGFNYNSTYNNTNGGYPYMGYQLLDNAATANPTNNGLGGFTSLLPDASMGTSRSFNSGYTPGPNQLAWSVTNGGLPLYQAAPTLGWNGFIIDAASPALASNMIGSVVFQGYTNFSSVAWDDFRFATFAPIPVVDVVPEPASVVLFCLGGFGLGLVGWVRRR